MGTAWNTEVDLDGHASARVSTTDVRTRQLSRNPSRFQRSNFILHFTSGAFHGDLATPIPRRRDVLATPQTSLCRATVSKVTSWNTHGTRRVPFPVHCACSGGLFCMRCSSPGPGL